MSGPDVAGDVCPPEVRRSPSGSGGGGHGAGKRFSAADEVGVEAAGAFGICGGR